MAAPGVKIQTAVRSGPTGTPRAMSGQYFPIGLAERGPTDKPVQINSMGDYKRWFGDRTSYGALFDDLTAYFEVGGTQAWVQRVVGAAATTGTLMLNDGAGAPAPTIKVDAASEGAWSSGVTVQVENGTNGNTGRKITIRLGGEIVQQADNLSSIAAIVSAFSGSPYVKMIDQGSVAAGALALPAVLAATALSAGTDDRASVNAARLEAKLPQFKIGLGDGAVAAPGYGQSMHAALIAHARTHRRIALLDAARGTSASALATLGLAQGATTGSQHAGLFGPHLIVSDGVGGTRVISPAGYVAGARCRGHDLYGPWQPAAGAGSLSDYIIGVDQEFDAADAEVLDSGRVSPIRLVGNRVRLYGWRSLSSNEVDYSSLTVQDTLNRLNTECESRLEPYVFRTVDGRGQLLAEMAGVLIGVLEPIRAAGGIFERVDAVSGEALDSGYSVDVSPQINTVESLARNEVRAQIAVRLAPNASLINLTIVKVGLAAAV
jgi:hypothetical protein